MSGILFLIVGPSGAGKDTLIDGARGMLSGDRRFAFPTRFITRGGDAGGESHMPVDREEFDNLREGGFFALTWDAHGLSYGVTGGIIQDLGHGRNVVVNASRSIISEAARRFPRVHVIKVKASGHVLMQRLRERNRESSDDMSSRLARADLAVPEDVPVSTILNEGSVEEGVRAFVAGLEAASR